MSAKRGPSVLVTDARERPSARGASQRPGTAAGSPSHMPMRFISVDNVLQYASEIPSGQPRMPPGPRPAPPGQTVVRRSSQGRNLPTIASLRTGQQIVPSRTTKISEKLVLLPDMDERDGDDGGLGEGEDDEEDDEEEALVRRASMVRSTVGDDDDSRPLRDEELDVLRRRGGLRGKSYAERLPKVQRTDKFSRVTAYCTAQAFKMKAAAEFLRKKHDAKTKLYDDCLYTVYHVPLLAGTEGYRVRSRPILKTPGTGKTVLDLEIERSERRDEHMGYLDEDTYGVMRGHSESPESPHHMPNPHGDEHEDAGRRDDGGHYGGGDGHPADPMGRAHPDAKNFAEMFVYSYGVVVFWNFTEHQEKDILADLTFAENEVGVSLVTRPLDQSDYETEEFHFEYNVDVKRPRVFNDMITLLPRSDHMVKLTISHAIAQSTKLCFFEEKMSETMLDAQHVPKRLALTGELNMTRTEIVKILGRLFKSRVDINLSSNILDVPNFFWDSEPTLHPLYAAIREYLEIDPRIKVLNERCRVFLDLAEILSDSVADAKMSNITWIIIVLIIISIGVTVTEVGLRFGMLERGRGTESGAEGLLSLSPSSLSSAPDVAVSLPEVPTTLTAGADEPGVGEDMSLRLARANITEDDLRRWWSAQLNESDRAAVCGGAVVGKTFAGV